MLLNFFFVVMDDLVQDCLTSLFFFPFQKRKVCKFFINKVFTFMYVSVLFMCVSKCLTLVNP